MTLSSDQVLRALRIAGFVVVSQRGSHVKLRHPNGRTVIVPAGRDLRRGTLASILAQAGMTLDELRELL